MQTFSEEYSGKPKVKSRPKRGHKRNLKLLANIKPNITPNQIHLNSHSKGLFISVLTSQYNMSSFQQKIRSHAKGKKKNMA